ISVTDRAGFIGRVRKLARKTAEAYVASREAQGFPLGQRLVVTPSAAPPVQPADSKEKAEPGEAFLEIGVETLPAAWIRGLEGQLATLSRESLAEHRLSV